MARAQLSSLQAIIQHALQASALLCTVHIWACACVWEVGCLDHLVSHSSHSHTHIKLSHPFHDAPFSWPDTKSPVYECSFDWVEAMF